MASKDTESLDRNSGITTEGGSADAAIEAVNDATVPRPLPKFVACGDGTKEVEIQCQDGSQLSDVLGDSSAEFQTAILTGLASISGWSGDKQRDRNHALAMVAEIAPRDAVEAMLVTQMASVHLAAMRHSECMNYAETIQQLDIQERTFNKLMRTFTTQMEALRKHRHGGQQKVTVEHVTVNDGGQAIVGNVGGRQKDD